LKRFGDDFNEAEFRATNPNVLRRAGEIKEIEDKMRDALENEQLGDLKQLIEDLGIVCQSVVQKTGQMSNSSI
jgi:glycyl-tRNA synthetase